MNCLTNINRTQVPHDIIMAYINIYKSIGMNDYNHEALNSDYQVMVRQTINNDTYYFVKFLELNVSETRLKSLIYKDILPKNKDEKFILNLKKVFIKIHKETSTFELMTNEVFDLLNFLYKDVLNENKLGFKKTEKKSNKVNLYNGKLTSKREDLDQIISLYHSITSDNKYEISYIAINFFVDFINIAPFIEKNEEIGILLLYILLITNSYEAFEFISFMELLNENKDEFYRVLRNASYNWVEGFSQLLPFHRFVINVSLQAYNKINLLIRDHEFDAHLNKSNNVENTIHKLDDVFSKDDIRIAHPYISDSTINRTLKRLRDEEKIRPLGKGRSAKWIKLFESKNKKVVYEQLDLNL
ncbi:MAG: hypothetical protein KQ78_01355 [Candidatus Izimaplasma bacterium HR2]|nr:MAG: hypothetical protein KQ78_01355 [Candidatus Izimaplasma bacterium HR2]